MSAIMLFVLEATNLGMTVRVITDWKSYCYLKEAVFLTFWVWGLGFWKCDDFAASANITIDMILMMILMMLVVAEPVHPSEGGAGSEGKVHRYNIYLCRV